MFCVKCGNTMEEGELFCPKCGTPAGGVAAGEPVGMKSTGSKKKAPAGSGALKKKNKALIAAVVGVIAVIAVIIAVVAVLLIHGSNPVKDLKEARVGDTVTYGTYEQDGDYDNGKEAIEWIVLDKQDGKLLLVSRYALEGTYYEYEPATWEKCSLRKWLNTGFMKEAFTQKEIKHIPTMRVSADKNPEYDTDPRNEVYLPWDDIDPGNDTEDQVFLLSVSEAEKYFKTDHERRCEPTEYARIMGAYKYNEGYCEWWLRSTDEFGRPANVDDDGLVNYDKFGYSNSLAVRPAMWVDLN